MPRQQQKQKRLAQNFLRDVRLVRRLVRVAKLNSSDTIYEIGPGLGIITAELSRVAERVIAIEKDSALVRRLRERFRTIKNVEIVEGDFLEHSVTRPDYKIFASIPFNLTASIVRKILWTRPTPTDAFLIMQREPARRFAGLGGETLFSITAKPYFEFDITARLKKTDFVPVPDVESVLLRIHRRADALISRTDSRAYREFATLGFAGWKPNLRTAYKRVFTYTQWKRLARDIHFPINATPTGLTFDQWLRLFEAFKKLKLPG